MTTTNAREVFRRGRSKELPLAPEEQQAQKNLLRIWEEKAKSLGLTQRSLAKSYGVNPSFISQLKHGFVPINFNWLMRLAKVLRVVPEDIMPTYKEFFNVGECNTKGKVAVPLVATKRQGDRDIMATLTRELISYPLFGSSDTKAVEILDESTLAPEIQFGTHVIFGDDPATKANRLAVAILNENPAHHRIVISTNGNWRDVFDNEVVARGWAFKRVKALVYNA
ncbi:MAG: helix-turn-helix transcriptional regulator [Halothiobacillus sp.]|nr:helix-turn-helix transcriptional regulator [Halothiobacillus sp.]